MGKLCLLVAVALVGMSASAAATEVSPVLVLTEPEFPAADSAAPTAPELQDLLPQATLVRAAELPDLLARHGTRLLVLPYGSAFPEQAWPAIHRYLQRGGNLLVVGGKPFTRAAVHDGKGWRLRPDSVRFTRPLMIDQYQTTPGSQGLQLLPNPDLSDLSVKLPAFDWARAYGLVIRLSAVDLYKRGGSAGALDARLDTLVWGSKDGIKLAAPVVQIDHLQNGFDGGRWIFVNAELTPGFWSGPAAQMVRTLAERASQGAHLFTARPHLPLYRQGEDVLIDVAYRRPRHDKHARTVRISLFPEAQPSQRTVVAEVASTVKVVKTRAPADTGLYLIEAQLLEDGEPRASYRSGFWMRDEAFLRSGPRLAVGRDYFELNGKPLAVLGTTHMSSEVQRLFFAQPNVAVWDRDLAHIRAAGLNMIRTGWWTGWDTVCDGEGKPNEAALRTLEAYLMTARRHGLPVQFNFFAFAPDVLGGKNPYLDPTAVRHQRELVTGVVARFHDVPFVAWDLVNEPSFSTRLWMMRPNGDELEKAAWNAWLDQRYPDKGDLAERWNAATAAIAGSVPPPSDGEFWSRGVYAGHSSLRVYDYFQFAQESFTAWARGLRDAIHATGSRQLITVGQDEGGVQDRLSPAYWSKATDFTTNHSWWQNDALLWDSLAAKQPGQAMLIQETGLQRELAPDQKARRGLDSEAALLERKVALSFVRGAGAIQWLWHANSYMTDSNETPIGAIRPDGTEKPEATVLRKLAQFATALSPYLHDPAPPAVAVVTSQAAQFSVLADLQLEAQRKAVRALAYQARIVPVVVAENRLADLPDVSLAILPSPQALTDQAWRSLLAFVERGGTLLITGPVERDEHWRVRPRAGELGLAATARPLTYHQTEILPPGSPPITLSFDQTKQAALDTLSFAHGSGFGELRRGKGRVFWASDPVELAEGTDAAAALYRHVLARVGISPRFELPKNASPAILVAPIPLGRDVLYIIVSEDAHDRPLDLADKPTGVRMTFTLPAERAALAIVDGSKRKLVATYGF